MRFNETSLAGLVEIIPQTYEDNRGYFFETLKTWELNRFCGKEFNFIQENESMSVFGTVRGLHYQLADFAQTKLIRVISGKVLDVVVDLRSKSKTFGQTYSTILDSENKKQLLIPKGFAHGQITLSKNAIFLYKIDSIYSPKHERGINFKDPTLAIDWSLQDSDLLFSKRDSLLPNFQFDKYYF